VNPDSSYKLKRNFPTVVEYEVNLGTMKGALTISKPKTPYYSFTVEAL